MSFGKSDGGVSHRLLVVSAEGRQLRARGVERLAETGDVAVTENREHTGHERHLDTVDLRSLASEIPNERLGHCESVGVRRRTSLRNSGIL